jgi:hypothetical protein
MTSLHVSDLSPCVLSLLLAAQIPMYNGTIDSFGFPTTQFCVKTDGSHIKEEWIGQDTPTLTYADPCECESSGLSYDMPSMAPAPAPMAAMPVSSGAHAHMHHG